jgi:DNA-binding NarL/FixJ family response regulator
MTQEQIRVVIVDDHPGVRAGIRYLLVNAKDIDVVGEGANGVEAVQLASTHKPDVMLLDVELPLLRGDEAVRLIRGKHPEVKVLAVSSYSDRQYIQEMMANGAAGYITKDEVPELLLEAVRSIYNENHIWLSPRANRINRPGG